MTLARLLKEASEPRNNFDGKGKQRIIALYRLLQKVRNGLYYWDEKNPPPDIKYGSVKWKKIYEK